MLEVVLLTNSRFDFFKSAIHTLSLSYKNIHKVKDTNIIISCNSSDIRYQCLVEQYCKKNSFTYRHSKSFSARQHYFNTIELAKSDYLLILHDDDLYEITFLNEYINMIHKFPYYFSYALNSSFNFIDKIKYPNSNYNKSYFELNLIIVLFMYLFGKAGPLFPTFCFKTIELKNYLNVIKNQKQNYCEDVKFVIYFLKKKTLFSTTLNHQYRIHSNNDHKNTDFYSKILIKVFILKNIFISFLFFKFSLKNFINTTKIYLFRHRLFCTYKKLG